MKFAKELEHEAVPEWRIKYLNYKAGKKYIKAISRARDRTSSSRLKAQTPRASRAGHATPTVGSARLNDQQTTPAAHRTPGTDPPTTDSKPNEGRSLTGGGNKAVSYGSFVPSPPARTPISHEEENGNRFELPAPALRVSSETSEPSKPGELFRRHLSRPIIQRSATLAHVPSMSPEGSLQSTTLNRTISSGIGKDAPSPLRRLLSHSFIFTSRGQPGMDVRMQNVAGFDLVGERERDFFKFMDSELEKVNSFYKLKEEQADARLTMLRDQLHEMRNRRIQELAQEQFIDDHHSQEGPPEERLDKANGWAQPFKAKIFSPGPNSKALRNMPNTPPHIGHRIGDASRDYTRRRPGQDVPYRSAKRKLKLALQEFYRGLELLKSYALLNRTAFRKLNKKYDKAMGARPPYRYMNEYVNQSWFVTSEALERHIKAVEDLYARYFERGNHKLAAGKLRSLARKPSDESGSSFLNGLLLGVGVVFTVQGLVYGVRLLFDEDPVLHVQTSFLLQIYGGYFLMWTLFMLFCIDCFIWTKAKINYPFIFEFDQRHHLDWRRLAEFPSFFLLLFGVFMWANFSQYGPASLYLYYPVILIGITVSMIFLPAPILAHKARRWFAYAHWRLLLAGLYPVEFRDFFLGDIYCSLTYATANIELFFCLYARGWSDPPQCNSSHSRALGFLTTLPAIWRSFQCIRRYKDTRNIFPHLVNCGKYAMTILYYITLSLYRINGSNGQLALFITFAAINAIYCSVWDLFMDFSLLQTHSRHMFLRDILALKRRWPYYLIMIVDPVLRFIWIFYAIFTHNTQHSTLASFLISFAEVMRRGLWALFRVENEHCANVAQYKASRDVPLPYRIEPLMDRASTESSPLVTSQGEHAIQEQDERRRAKQKQREQELSPTEDPESMGASSTGVFSSFAETVRRRTDTSLTMRPKRFSKILAEAHKQDFQKRRPAAGRSTEEEEDQEAQSDDDDDEEYDEGEHAIEMEDSVEPPKNNDLPHE